MGKTEQVHFADDFGQVYASRFLFSGLVASSTCPSPCLATSHVLLQILIQYAVSDEAVPFLGAETMSRSIGPSLTYQNTIRNALPTDAIQSQSGLNGLPLGQPVPVTTTLTLDANGTVTGVESTFTTPTALIPTERLFGFEFVPASVSSVRLGPAASDTTSVPNLKNRWNGITGYGYAGALAQPWDDVPATPPISVHTSVRRTPLAQQQANAFFEESLFVNTCDRLCIVPFPVPLVPSPASSGNVTSASEGSAAAASSEPASPAQFTNAGAMPQVVVSSLMIITDSVHDDYIAAFRSHMQRTADELNLGIAAEVGRR